MVKTNRKRSEQIIIMKKEMEVKDALIKNLTFLLIEHKITIPDKILNIIKTFYGPVKNG